MEIDRRDMRVLFSDVLVPTYRSKILPIYTIDDCRMLLITCMQIWNKYRNIETYFPSLYWKYTYAIYSTYDTIDVMLANTFQCDAITCNITSTIDSNKINPILTHLFLSTTHWRTQSILTDWELEILYSSNLLFKSSRYYTHHWLHHGNV